MQDVLCKGSTMHSNIQCSHQDFALGAPLLRNGAPVRTSRGQSEPALQMICYVKYTYPIQYGGWSVWDSITMHVPISAMYVG